MTRELSSRFQKIRFSSVWCCWFCNKSAINSPANGYLLVVGSIGIIGWKQVFWNIRTKIHYYINRYSKFLQVETLNNFKYKCYSLNKSSFSWMVLKTPVLAELTNESWWKNWKGSSTLARLEEEIVKDIWKFSESTLQVSLLCFKPRWFFNKSKTK
jgi:hypothetical protein